jgi:hypothetical protein
MQRGPRWWLGLVVGCAAISASGALMVREQAGAAAVPESSPAAAAPGTRAAQSRAMGGMGGLSCEKPPKKLHYDAAKQAKWIAEAREDGFKVLAVAHACAYGFLYRDRPLTPQAKAARSYTEKQQEKEMRKYGIDPNPWVAFSGGDLLLVVADDAAPDARRDGSYLRALYPRGWMSRGYVSRGNVQLLEEIAE